MRWRKTQIHGVKRKLYDKFLDLLKKEKELQLRKQEESNKTGMYQLTK